VAGTDPNAAGSPFKLQLVLLGAERRVSFTARRAEGAGYEGKQRYYALESSAGPAGPWTGIDGFTNVLGDNQAVLFQAVNPAGPVFYRGRVWLQP
jgi:hypothetical protein